MKLIKDHKVSYRRAVTVEICDITVGKIQRGFKTKKEGRQTQIWGRPFIFDSVEEVEAIEMLKAKNDDDALILEEARHQI